INGVSKSHAMTGWRIGYACGDKALIKGLTGLASQSTSNPSTPSQWAAVAAYEMDRSFLTEFNETFRQRRDHAYNLLEEIPYTTCIKPEGAFYLFPNLRNVRIRWVMILWTISSKTCLKMLMLLLFRDPLSVWKIIYASAIQQVKK